MAEITLEELNLLNKDEYMLIDVRGDVSFEYGKIDGAINIPADNFDKTKLDKTKKIMELIKENDILGRKIGQAENLLNEWEKKKEESFEK